MGTLTERVLEDASSRLLDQFKLLKPNGDREPTVEDLINYLVRYRDILNTITNEGGHPITTEDIDEWLTLIKRKIVSEVADDWESSDYHLRFLKRICNPRQGRSRDIFSLNYDTVVEASLDHLRISYVDGFRGTNRAWFEPEVFDKVEGSSPFFRVFKLHGSINWTRDDEGHVRRGRNANEDASGEPVVVYPSEQKYLQTQYGVYETLISLFRNRMRQTGANNCLVVLGYSFNDEHINEAIIDAIVAPNSNLTVISFVGPDSDSDKQVNRLRALASRSDHRFNAFIGSGDTGNFVGHALDEISAKAVLDEELWKFEKMVTFIAGDNQ